MLGILTWLLNDSCGDEEISNDDSICDDENKSICDIDNDHVEQVQAMLQGPSMASKHGQW